MPRLNPEKLISEYIGALINVVDVHTDEQLREYPRNDLITIKIKQVENDETESAEESEDESESQDESETESNDSLEVYKNPYLNKRLRYKLKPTKPESDKTRVWDYLNGVRNEMIKRLNELQNQALDQFEMVKHKLDLDYDDLRPSKNKKEMTEQFMDKVFKRGFPFVVKVERSKRYKRLDFLQPTVFVNNEPLEFDLFLIEVEFFLGEFELNVLRYDLDV